MSLLKDMRNYIKSKGEMWKYVTIHRRYIFLGSYIIRWGSAKCEIKTTEITLKTIPSMLNRAYGRLTARVNI